MIYESPRKIFRDMNKNPDKYVNDFQEKAIIKEELKKDELNNANIGKKKLTIEKKEFEPMTTCGKAFKNTVDNVFEAGLLEGVKNESELKIVAQRRKITLDYLTKVLEDVRNYLTQINAGQLQKISSYDDIGKYQLAMKSSDEARRAHHDRLISDVKIAIRLININFNADFSEKLRLEAEIKMPDRKGDSVESLQKKMLQRKYFKFNFPAGGFIDVSKIPKDSQGEREYIAHWALTLYSDLSGLYENINKNLDQLE